MQDLVAPAVVEADVGLKALDAGGDLIRLIDEFPKFRRQHAEVAQKAQTVYAFSTENWKRPKDEVDGIMHLLEQYLHECIDTMEKDGNRLHFLGDLSVLTPELRALIDETNEISSRIEGFQANVCLNYGGRDEILHAARAFARDCAAGERDADSLTEEGFSRYLYSSGLPDPDLLIRPGGEKRISNYLLWQCAYSEFYFCDTLWPDFTEKEFDKALIAYQHRERRFGGLKQEKQK